MKKKCKTHITGFGVTLVFWWLKTINHLLEVYQNFQGIGAINIIFFNAMP